MHGNSSSIILQVILRLALQVGFGSGFKVNSAVWKALRTFKDPSHVAWSCVSSKDVDAMWEDLEGMGVRFVDGVMPPYESKKKPVQGSNKE